MLDRVCVVDSTDATSGYCSIPCGESSIACPGGTTCQSFYDSRGSVFTDCVPKPPLPATTNG
jgi:hypothetical protein